VTAPGLYAEVVGQERAVAHLMAAARAPVHAYLLVGPPGTGVREAARSFAAALVCAEGGCTQCEVCGRVIAGVHPDVRFFERTGAFLRVEEIRPILEVASRSPVEAPRKVLVLVDFHLVAEQYPRLLKAIEEPPPTTVFLVLAEHVPPELSTIASRCVRIDFPPVPEEVVREALVAEGVNAAVAADVAAASAGRIDRARLLASDPGFVQRREAWRAVPGRLDGTGATAFVLAKELLAGPETMLAPLAARHAAELAALVERARLYGERAGERKELEARHKREERRLRTDELRFGLSALAGAYRDRLSSDRHPGASLAALEAVAAAHEALVRNPNVPLLLQALLVRLGRLH
jgi:DNA polymerase-3 subunit delta'